MMRARAPKRFLARKRKGRVALEEHKPKKPVDLVELGPGVKAIELRALQKKPGRELHGIDAAARERLIQENNSVLWLKRGKFKKALDSYGKESVKLFRMKIVLSYQGKPERVAKRYKRVFQQVFEKLVPGGRFLVSETKEHIEAIKPVLEELGFKITILRPVKESEKKSFWQKVYARGTKKPWELVAVKPRKKKNK